MNPSLQHAIKRVERPGGSHEGVGRKKKSCGSGFFLPRIPPFCFHHKLPNISQPTEPSYVYQPPPRSFFFPPAWPIRTRHGPYNSVSGEKH